MSILQRVERLEAVLLQPVKDVEYKLVLLKGQETREEGIKRTNLTNWPNDRIMAITFVSPRRKSALAEISSIGAESPASGRY